MSCITQHQTMVHCDTGLTDEEKAGFLRDKIMDESFDFKTDDGQRHISVHTELDEMCSGDEWLKGLLLSVRHGHIRDAQAILNDKLSEMVYDKSLEAIRDYEL